MGIFSSLFGKGKTPNGASGADSGDDSGKPPVFWAPLSASMEDAMEEARRTFKYFWREIYWERRRLIKAHNMASVKARFEQDMDGSGDPVVEHMWVSDIDFDGEIISGTLLNQPNVINNVSAGEAVKIPMSQLSDWMVVIAGKAHGGFTVQHMRSEMTPPQRKAHDNAWGIDFGDFNKVEMVYQQTKHPENLIEHPMSRNMTEKTQEWIAENPHFLTHQDDFGRTMLHYEAIAGNRTAIDFLLAGGADKNLKDERGKTPLDYARALNWEHVIPVLE